MRTIAPQLAQLQAAVQDLLTARHSMQLHSAALQDLKGSYQVRILNANSAYQTSAGSRVLVGAVMTRGPVEISGTQHVRAR